MQSIDYPTPSPFICPAIRTGNIDRFQQKNINETPYLIIDNSYHISETEEETSSHSHHLRLFLACNNKEGGLNDLYCNACRTYKIGTTFYFCNECDNSYHKECVESPPIFISPCHPKYLLQLLKIYSGISKEECHSCGLEIIGLVYYSFTCDLIMDPVCAKKQEFSTINNPKRHKHILHYFPRKVSLTCDVCALDDNKCCFYACLQCDFIVHCIDLPRVILISCHNHRLSFTSYLSSENWFCGVCRRKIDENYGEYSCTKDCTYAVHSKCVILPDVWDGKELEDEPEVEYDNIKPFEEIGDGIIRHFSHAHHHMRLDEDVERVFDDNQLCQACIRPLYDGHVYRCMQCDFNFHEVCANLPRIKHSVVHPHPLDLKPNVIGSYFLCESCFRYSCGFRYMCSEGPFCHVVDVICASLSGLVDHQSHPHPLFLVFERRTHQTCSACGREPSRSLNCDGCNFVLCIGCANLPYKVKHKNDEHMLTLSYEKNESGLYWCQVCEETTDPKKGYYTCNECGGVTFHIECILGPELYMKVGQIINLCEKVEIIPNNRLSRPICNGCQRRCQYNIVYETPHGNIFCSVGEVTWDRRS